MTTQFKRPGTLVLGLVAIALTVAVFGGGISAHEGHDHGPATPAASPEAGHGDMQSVGVAYLTISNDGDEADRLNGASTSMAEVVEIHETKDENGVGVMMPVEGGVEIPAGGEAVLESNGIHLMLFGLTASLLPDTTYELTLTFERAGDVTITVPVQRNAPGDGDAGQPVEVGDLTIEGAWSRPAPKLGGAATPAASPDAHEGH